MNVYIKIILPLVVIVIGLSYGLRGVYLSTRTKPWQLLINRFSTSHFKGALKSEVIYVGFDGKWKAYRFFRLGCNSGGLAIVPELPLKPMIPSLFIPWSKLNSEGGQKKKIHMIRHKSLLVDQEDVSICIPERYLSQSNPG